MTMPSVTMRWLSLITAVACYLCRASATAIDNNIIGQPEVICRDDSLRILVNTRRPFNGHIYVKVSRVCSMW